MATPDETSALNSIADWCKWLVAIETGAIGFIATMLKPGSENVAVLQPFTTWGLLVAVVCFGLSIIVAAATLTAIPASFVDLHFDERGGQVNQVWHRGVFYWSGRGYGSLEAAAKTLFVLFVLGIVAFGASVISKLW